MKRATWGLVLSAFIAGCAVDDVVVERTYVDELTQSGGWAIQTNGDAMLDIGPTAGRTCWLDGITGNVDATFGSVVIGIEDIHSEYYFHVKANNPVKAWAHCVVATGTWDVVGYRGQTIIAPYSSTFGCYLTHLSLLQDSKLPTALTLSTDNIKITNDQDHYYLSIDTLGELSANARCVEGTAQLGTWIAIAGDNGGFAQFAMTDNPAAICGLQQLKGSFTDTDLLQGGVTVKRDPTTDLWTLTAANGKRGTATCLE